jgi:hypothetical protein
LLALLAQAAAKAQTSISQQAVDSSPLRFFDEPDLDMTAPGITDPALLALADAAGTGTAASGGLWLSGDTARGLTYLQWIAGNQQGGLLKMDSGGKVSFNLKKLSNAAGVTSENTANQRERISSFVRSDEGLRLLAELTNGSYRFLLHVGPMAPTRGGNVKTDGTRNLDNRFDRRINPLRRKGQKLDNERPPEGFDSLIAINPDANWFNFYNKQLMPTAQMVFHELAESHARLALDLDYLPQPGKPGAHDVAIYREIRLKQERPSQSVLMPIGMNLLLASRNDWLALFDRLREIKGAKTFRNVLLRSYPDPLLQMR